MTHTTPRAELEPADTDPTPVAACLGLCDFCGEPVRPDDPNAYFPPAHRPRLACGGCIARRHDLGAGG